jgi:hypothetical protein
MCELFTTTAWAAGRLSTQSGAAFDLGLGLSAYFVLHHCSTSDDAILRTYVSSSDGVLVDSCIRVLYAF